MKLQDRYSKEDISYFFGDDIANKAFPVQPFAKINFVEKSNGTFSHNGYKTASIISLALMSDNSQKVRYLIMWDKYESRPEGNHLNQNDKTLVGKFIEDLGQDRKPITNREGYLFEDCSFCFLDEIVQPQLIGTWTFKLQVLSSKDEVLAEDSIVLDWDNMDFSTTFK